MIDNEKRQQQLNREADCIDSGYAKFLKDERRMREESNGSNTLFAVWVKKHLLGEIVDDMKSTLNDLNNTRASLARTVIEDCLMGGKSSGDFTEHGFWDINEAAFTGFQLALDTALNPNTQDRKVNSKHGGDKKLLAKKTIPELQAYIGNVLNQQIGLKIVKQLFPEWYRVVDQECQKKNKDGMKATTSYWEYRMRRAIKAKAAKCDKEGDSIGAHILRHREPWSYQQRLIIGAWILRSVVRASDTFAEQSKIVDSKTQNYLVLSEAAEDKRAELMEYAKTYSMQLLPMMIEPEPVSNLSLGGWLTDSLQQPEKSFSGSIQLSDRHLEFINRQARVPFQINPFTYELLKQLVDRQLPLGKFHYQELEDLPSIPQMLGYGHITDLDEQDRMVRSNPEAFAKAKRDRSDIKDRNLARVQNSLMAYQVLDKAKHLLEDDQFYIPMKFDFRGRIYSRVPFISFQSNDCGRYLIRFAEKTPVDDRTEHWFKVGISNAAGNDKKCWDERIQWFDNNRDEIINVGQMIDGGDFTRAYEFLTQDCIDDAFCLAALANEYVKVFIDGQDYTQCYVCVDASCSGTSIFNAWRRNKNGGRKVNLVDTESPQDIYMAVWDKLKSKAKTFDKQFIERLESSKLLRKMMKTTYVPASYASPEQEQLRKLKQYNKDKLIPAGIGFNEEQLTELLSLWTEALDDVSSISTVVNWFQSRVKEAFDNGATEIYYTSCNGSKMTLKYPKTKLKRIKLPSRGSTLFTQASVQETTSDTNKRKLKTAVTSNITHLTDASALCESLWNWDGPFVGIHDACGLPISAALDDGVMALKQGLITATQHNVWDTFRTDNGLPLNAKTAGPVIGDLKLKDILKSNYIYS